MTLELYHNDMSACAQKVRLTLAEKGIQWQGHHLDLRAGDQQKADYLRLNPKGVVPTLVEDGKVVRESTVIMEYLEDRYPEPPLRPPPHSACRWNSLLRVPAPCSAVFPVKGV